MRALTKNVLNEAANSRSVKMGNDISPTARSKPWHVLHRALGNQGVQAKLRVNQPSNLFKPDVGRVAEAPASIDHVLARPGTPLDPPLRIDMERRFGHDFSAVRVHTDARAADSARAVNALAYTMGDDIVFDTGQYAPGTPEGQRLLAHELAHTIQQSRTFGRVASAEAPRASARVIQRQPAPEASPVQPRQIRRIILYKNQMMAEHVFQDSEGHETRETVSVRKHCDPLPGLYTADVTGGTRKWRTRENIGCTLPLGYVINQDHDQYTRLKIADGFQGVTTFEFEVNYSSETGGESLGPGSGKGTAPQDTAGDVTADPLDATLEEIAALPPHIKEFLTSAKGRRLRPQDYDTVLRIGKRLEFEGVSELELFDLKNKARRAKTWSETEASLDRVFEERSSRQQQRAHNVAEREELDVRLSTDIIGLYVNVYRRYYDATQGWKKSPIFSEEAASLREQLNAELPEHGFHDVAAFELTIKTYLDSFTNETLAIASDLLLKFEYILTREKAKFNSPESPDAVRLLARFAPVKQTAQSRYQQAEESSQAAAREQFVAAISLEGFSVAPLFGGPEPKKPHTKRMAEHQREARAYEEQASGMVEKEAVGHDIVSWQDFPRAELVSATTPADVGNLINGYINEHAVSISKARAILESPKGRDRIFELDTLLDMSIAAQGIDKGSLQGLIIFDRKDDIERQKLATDLLVGLIALALSIVVPVGGAAGFIAAGSAFVLSAFQADEMLQAYAENERLYMAQLLSSEPSITWAVIAVVAAVADGTAAVNALKTVVAPAARAFNRSQDLAELGRSLEGLEPTIQQSIMTAARKAERAAKQFEHHVKKLRELWTTGGGKARGVAIPGGETLARLVAITYYFFKTRVVQFSFADYLKTLQDGGVIDDIGKLTAEQKKLFRRAFIEAYDRSRSAQFVYGDQVFKQLSERARATFTREEVDLIAAEGKTLGKTDDEIREAVESRSLQAEIEEAEGGREAMLPPGQQALQETGMKETVGVPGPAPLESGISGTLGETEHAIEVTGRVPQKSQDLFSTTEILRERDALLRGDITLRELVENYPPEGVAQVFFPTARGGGRFIDHVYFEETTMFVVFRESKRYGRFSLGTRELVQLEKDLAFLSHPQFKGLRIEWRISGGVGQDTLAVLDELQTNSQGLFRYVLDPVVP